MHLYTQAAMQGVLIFFLTKERTSRVKIPRAHGSYKDVCSQGREQRRYMGGKKTEGSRIVAKVLRQRRMVWIVRQKTWSREQN